MHLFCDFCFGPATLILRQAPKLDTFPGQKASFIEEVEESWAKNGGERKSAPVSFEKEDRFAAQRLAQLDAKRWRPLKARWTNWYGAQRLRGFSDAL